MKFIVILLSFPLLVLWKAYVFTFLWAWFIASTFHVAQLQIAPAAGIALIASFLTFQFDLNHHDEWWHVLAVGIGKPSVALFFGYIYSRFM